MTSNLRLGVNIDHIATLRNARGGVHPDPVQGALLAIDAGAHGITAHLREDRRHIRDTDMFALKEHISVALNFEMAANDDMIALARQVQPNACCLVPERREELTTEGGLDVIGGKQRLVRQVAVIKTFGARVSLFLDAEESAMHAAADVGADIVELHTGPLAHAYGDDPDGGEVMAQLERLQAAARIAQSLGLEVHAGHGLTYETAQMVAAMPEIVELNIGHFLIGEAVMIGMKPAVEAMLHAMDKGVEGRTR